MVRQLTCKNLPDRRAIDRESPHARYYQSNRLLCSNAEKLVSVTRASADPNAYTQAACRYDKTLGRSSLLEPRNRGFFFGSRPAFVENFNQSVYQIAVCR